MLQPGANGEREPVDEIHELEPLASERELEVARESAADRAWLGDGIIVDVERLEWASGAGPDTTLCFARIASGVHAGELCRLDAGSGTGHPGVGRCYRHGGATPAGVREAAWVVAHGFARALDVTPWEGLLWAVKIAAGRVAFIEEKLGGAWTDRQLEPPTTSYGAAGRVEENEAGQAGQNLNYWVKQAELWHGKLAQVSKLAIDAGVAERLVRQLELEAQLMLRATNRTFDELGLDEDVRERALLLMSRNLLALEAEEVGTPE